MRARVSLAAMLVLSLMAGGLLGCGERTPAPGASALPTTQAIAKARLAADQLQQRLQTELLSAMRAGGPVAAIGVCKQRAPALAKTASTAQLKIARTALRLRNPANAPDDWERAQLEAFAARRAAGEDWAGMEATLLENGRLRWMRPIVLQEPCAACHGSEAAVAPETAAAIAAAYPQDEATGFAVGELRGAFTAQVRVD